jgi:hypothetical protein
VRIHIRLALVLLMMVPAAIPAEAPAGEALCSAQVFRQFDFWLGKWDVKNADGTPAGRNEITSEENGCVLLERWRSVGGNTGMSMNYFDPAASRWKQRWVGVGIVLEMEGGLRDGAMVMEGPLYYLADKRQTRLRGTWSRLPDGRVRQHFVESEDGGKTWKLWFDGYYTRVK